MMLPLNTTLVISQVLFILHLNNIHTDFLTLNVIDGIDGGIDHKLTGVAEDKLTIQRSSSYSIWLIRLPLMDPPIEDLFKISLRPLMYMLKSWGDRMLPWRTLLVTLKLSEMQAPHLIVISCF